jgi:hypothetical protein
MQKKVEAQANIKVYNARSEVSSYEIASKSNLAIIYGSKIGCEIAALGIPVVVCGESWARGKDFTIDVKKSGELENAIKRCISLSSIELELMRKRALSYSYWFFFKKMMKIEALEPTGKRKSPYKAILKGEKSEYAKCRGFMEVIKGILIGSELVMTYEVPDDV